MQKYPVRATHRANLKPENLASLVRAHFESVEVKDEGITARFGAISALKVRPEGRELLLEVTMEPKVPEAVAKETIRRYNEFLQQATGYSSKERARRIRKSAPEKTGGP